jgi:hypothetical protein
LWQLAGNTTTAPFSTEQWHTLLCELSSPFSETGAFDIYNVSSVKLRLQDGGNKTGTIWWDDVQAIEQITVIERIYIEANRSFLLPLDPVEIAQSGEIVGVSIKNNGTSSGEFTATAKGVSP